VEEPQVKVSYYLKNPTICPACGTSFYKEEMLSGGGRLIAKTITDELRREYQPSKKVGRVHPLIYPVTVCPECLYAAFTEDFSLLKKELIATAFSQRRKRKSDVSLIFPVIDFTAPRNLYSGTASYILAIGCYSFHHKDQAPTFKKALASLRCAWLFHDLDGAYPGQNYDRLQLFMYRKAMRYYEKVIGYAQTGQERIDGVKNFGPDIDKNFGFEGVLFISTLLLFKYGDEGDVHERVAKLLSAKRIVSRIFGSGKSSKSKPSFILDQAKDLYEKITERIEELG
jgi:uncharacterized protein (DUF2225 family)